MDEVLLARHGESETTARGIVGGDAPLTERGRAQARELAEAVAAFAPDVCLTSAARRARETAELALGDSAVPVEVVGELGDIGFGSFDGEPLEAYRAWVASQPPTAAPDGGESRVDTLARFARAFRAVLARGEARVLLVAHGLTVRAVLDERPQPVVAGAPYGHAVRLTRGELATAVERLERWCAAPAW